MRNFVIIILLILPFISSSQLTDTTCIKSRWIALKPTEVNKNIFLLDSTFNDSLDLVFTIKRLVENEKINIYNQNHSPNGNADIYSWYNINHNRTLEERKNDSIDYILSDPYFEIVVLAVEPYMSSFGEDSVSNSGELIYPPPTIYTFPARECDEIRIKENRVFNERTDQYEFIAVGLSFYFSGGRYRRGYEKFWVDLKQLFNAIEDNDKYPWYKAIINKEYQGFQYMQVSCYHDKIRE